MVYVLIVILGIVYVAAIYAGNHFPYDRVYWFFEFCHLLSGVLIADLLSQFITSPPSVIGGTLAVGCIWEIGEYVANYPGSIRHALRHFGFRIEMQTIGDTLLDLALDVAGALVFVFLLR